MSLGKGYKVGCRCASKSGGKKDIRSRQRSKFTRGEKTARHMMSEYQDAQVERETQPSITILIRMKKNDKFRANQELQQNKSLCQNIMTEFNTKNYWDYSHG